MSAGDRTCAQLLASLGVDPRDPGSFPFALGDVTAGSETELQVAVIGERARVDLPLAIQESNYFSNIVRRVTAGDAPPETISQLWSYLHRNPSGVWENSWVRFPTSALGPLARLILSNDLQSDKKDPSSAPRSDLDQFLIDLGGEPGLRVPISYLLKLALADACDDGRVFPPRLRQTALRVLPCFLNDNTSPETLSFHVTRLEPIRGNGRALADETARRFLLTHALVQYANHAFQLRARGQEATVFFSPLPPFRQRQLNRLIPDAFYRELFMSPCLSGWDRGEEKRDYMHLCHEVLSRSHLNAVGKLQESGIIHRNLVVLPSTSHTGLAANGTHVSLGSERWTDWSRSGALPADDSKRLADAVIKIVEHFLPLFVGRYSAAPSRLDYPDFHPETALGYLPHELDFTHLRMLWRRWKKKAKLRFCGKAFTPWGPLWIDRLVSRGLHLRGDHVPDRRLLEYPVALLGTALHSPLDGDPASELAFKRDLQTLGVFDTRMSTYLPYKRRSFEAHGFAGFEARHYSLFDRLRHDLSHGVDLQWLLNRLALDWLARGDVDPDEMPNDPESESERRQIFFACAVGIPTFYVRRNSRNAFLLRIIARTQKTRPSRRYPGYQRVLVDDYLRALTGLIADARPVIEALGLESTQQDLEARVSDRRATVATRLLNGILDSDKPRPLRLSAEEFESRSEAYYRGPLLERHLEEGIASLREEIGRLERRGLDAEDRETLRFILGTDESEAWLRALARDAQLTQLPPESVKKLIHLLLWVESHANDANETPSKRGAPA